jgi:hypothetical protein
VDVTQEREREAGNLEERVVGEGAIAADGEEDRAAFRELLRGLSQALELRRSDAAPVEAVEREDDVRFPLVLLEGDPAAEGRGE